MTTRKQHLVHSVRNSNGQTALHLACRYGHLDLVRFLVDQVGANVNDKHDAGGGGRSSEEMVNHHHNHQDRMIVLSPLGEAVEGGHLSIVQELLQHGANLWCVKKMVHTGVLRDTGRSRSRPQEEPSLSGASMTSGSTVTALHMAAYHGHLEIAQMLFNTIVQQQEPVHPQSVSSRRRLFRNDPAVRDSDSRSTTPTTTNASMETNKIVLPPPSPSDHSQSTVETDNHSASMETPQRIWKRASHFKESNNRYDTDRESWKDGKDIHEDAMDMEKTVDTTSDTIMTTGTLSFDSSATVTTAESSTTPTRSSPTFQATPSTRANDSSSMVWLSSSSDSSWVPVVEGKKKHDPSPSGPSLMYCLVNAKSVYDRTPLQLAAEQGHGQLVDLLLEHGACLHAMTFFGWTALDLACAGGHVDCMKRLVQATLNSVQQSSSTQNDSGESEPIHQVFSPRNDHQDSDASQRDSTAIASNYSFAPDASYATLSSAGVRLDPPPPPPNMSVVWNMPLFLAARDAPNDDAVEWLLLRIFLSPGEEDSESGNQSSSRKTPSSFVVEPIPSTLQQRADALALALHGATQRRGRHRRVSRLLQLGADPNHVIHNDEDDDNNTNNNDARGTNDEEEEQDTSRAREKKSNDVRQEYNDVSSATCSMKPPLLQAAGSAGDLSVVQCLVEEGQANLNGSDPLTGNTALHEALARGHMDIVHYLVDQGADWTVSNKDGRTCLHVAVSSLSSRSIHGNVAWRMIHYLITNAAKSTASSRKDGKAESPPKDDKTAQTTHSDPSTCHKNETDSVALSRLINQPYRPHGLTPLHEAVAVRCTGDPVQDKAVVSTIALLLEHGAHVNQPDAHGITPLHTATWNNATAIILLLLERGANVHQVDGTGKSVLHLASHCQNSFLVRQFLNHGADPNVSDNDGDHGWAPLHIAVLTGRLELVSDLLTRGANVHAKTRQAGCTPLFLACHAAPVAMIPYLVEAHGADVNTRDGQGQSALHQACGHDRYWLMEYLMDKGANPNATDHKGWSVLHEAIARDNCDTAQLLLEYGADVHGGMADLAEEEEEEEELDRLVESSDSRCCWSPLHEATWRQRPTLMNLLLRQGADPNRIDPVTELSALDVATQKEWHDLTHQLLCWTSMGDELSEAEEEEEEENDDGECVVDK